MADSLKLTVIKRMSTHLEGIVGVEMKDGTPVDMTGRVYRGRSVFGDETPLPMISIIEAAVPGDGPYADEANLIRNEEWSLIVQGFVEDDLDNPLDLAYALLAATELRMSMLIKTVQRAGRPSAAAFPDVYLLGQRPDGSPLVSGLFVGPGVVRPPDQKVSSTAFFYLPVRVVLATDVSQPYLQ